VNSAVSPELPERTTGTTGSAGSFRPGLPAAILGSFHEVISSVKMPAMTAPDNRRLVTCTPPMCRLQTNARPPAISHPGDRAHPHLCPASLEHDPSRGRPHA
jgi:hypothetical protein